MVTHSCAIIMGMGWLFLCLLCMWKLLCASPIGDAAGHLAGARAIATFVTAVVPAVSG